MVSRSFTFSSVALRATCVERPLIAASGFFTSWARRAAMPSSARVRPSLSSQSSSRRTASSRAMRSYALLIARPILKTASEAIVALTNESATNSPLAQWMRGASGLAQLADGGVRERGHHDEAEQEEREDRVALAIEVRVHRVADEERHHAEEQRAREAAGVADADQHAGARDDERQRRCGACCASRSADRHRRACRARTPRSGCRAEPAARRAPRGSRRR